MLIEYRVAVQRFESRQDEPSHVALAVAENQVIRLIAAGLMSEP